MNDEIKLIIEIFIYVLTFGVFIIITERNR
jgi:hypothetical protein